MAQLRVLATACALTLLSGSLVDDTALGDAPRSGLFERAATYTATGLAAGPGRRVVVADFNSDSARDVAVTTLGRLLVFLNNGDGTFGVPAQYPGVEGGSAFFGVAAADFDGDGAPDIAATDFNHASVLVFLNRGNGTFAPAVSYFADNFPDGVAVTDVDRDTDIDLAVAAAHPPGGLTVLLNNGNGTFGSQQLFGVAGSGRDVAVGNFNADTAPDLAVSSFGLNNVAILLNNGNGTFGTAIDYAVGDAPTGVATGDINVDSAEDLVVANAGSNTVSVLFGLGDGSFRPAVNYAAGLSPVTPTIANFAGNRSPEVAVANSAGSPTVSVLLNRGDGRFVMPFVASTTFAPSGVASGDLNTDGRTDLAVATRGNLTVLLHR